MKTSFALYFAFSENPRLTVQKLRNFAVQPCYGICTKKKQQLKRQFLKSHATKPPLNVKEF